MITVWKCDKCYKMNLLENGNICENLSCKFDLQMSENIQIKEISMDEYIELNGIKVQITKRAWKCSTCYAQNRAGRTNCINKNCKLKADKQIIFKMNLPKPFTYPSPVWNWLCDDPPAEDDIQTKYVWYASNQKHNCQWKLITAYKFQKSLCEKFDADPDACWLSTPVHEIVYHFDAR